LSGIFAFQAYLTFRRNYSGAVRLPCGHEFSPWNADRELNLDYRAVRCVT